MPPTTALQNGAQRSAPLHMRTRVALQGALVYACLQWAPAGVTTAVWLQDVQCRVDRLSTPARVQFRDFAVTSVARRTPPRLIVLRGRASQCPVLDAVQIERTMAVVA